MPRITPPKIICSLLLLFVALASGDSTFAGKEDQLDRRNYQVRIAIATGVKRIAIEATSAYHVVDPKGQSVYALKPGELHYVDIIPGRPGGKIYRLVIKDLDPHLESSAVTLARAAQQAYKLPAKAIRLPAKTAEETDRLLVTVGEFPTLEDARAYKEKLKNETIDFIFEEKARALQGQVMIHDYRSRIVAQDPSILRLVPLDIAAASLYLHIIDDSKPWKPGELTHDRHYRGKIDLAIDQEGALTVVNDLWIEYYLYGVVAAEMGDFAPMEALKAQAVAARSEAVAKIERGIVSTSPLYDFVDTALAQAYKGKGKESDSIRLAVDTTRGEILVHKGKPVDAVYGHSCGGVISSSSDMWDGSGEEYSVRESDRLKDRGVEDLSGFDAAHRWTSASVDSFCNPDQPGFPAYARDNFRWTKSYSADEFTRMLDKSYGTGRVLDVTVGTRSKSGRVRAMTVVGEKKKVKLDRELSIRSGMGDIKSTFFTFTIDYDKDKHLKSIKIYGAGFGHGVGLCQMGAFMMALKKYNYRQILGHYFNDVKVRRLYG